MNINKIGKDGYYATVTTADGHSWGFTVAEHHGTLFTMELANMIFQDVHYIDNETAAANLEMAQIKSIADAPNEVM